ncbi:WD40 repeat domain-containing protein [Methylocapsa aurea]|uniref:WD40 repeat domain-containing protein n=1 Tax=Methylocapsa aurea TaxID=663610 RepID=UPI0005669006|nr:WD-repeat family protein [Methylocapsa aurea]
MAQSTTSLTANVTPFEAGAPVTAVAFLGDVPALALGDGAVLLMGPGGAQRIAAHPDAAILVAAKAGEKLVTGGDDGRVMLIGGDGGAQEIAYEKGKWIDALAAREDGAIAWSTGKQVHARDAKGEIKTFAAPSTVRGLAFLPKGYRIAMAHYNGASLWFPNASAAPEVFEWKGSHLDITISPDGRFLLTSMQENALHGWRIADKKDMRLSGYPAKSRSLSWSFDGQWLATSGADAGVIWPFKDKEGPMNKAPQECGARRAKVASVAFHPNALVVAQGYDDGWVLLCRLPDAAEILVRGNREGAEAAITALAWDRAGRRLLFGTADGKAGLLDMPA